MELYIAEYLVENGFANDMVSALKILHVASDDWYGELLDEVVGDSDYRARKRAEVEQRRKQRERQTGVRLTQDQRQALRQSAAQRGASFSGGPVQSRTMNLPTPSQGRVTTAQTSATDAADRILRRDRSTSVGREAEQRRPTAEPTFVGSGGRQRLASQDPKADTTYTIVKPKAGQPISQATQDSYRAVAPGTQSTRRKSVRYSDSSNPPRG